MKEIDKRKPNVLLKMSAEFLIVSLAIVTIAYLVFGLEQRFESIIAQYTELREEYTLSEQFTKLFLICMIEVSFVGYLLSKQTKKADLSIAYLMLGLCLYLGESNMISEGTQPLFGAVLIIPIGLMLFSQRAWKSLMVMVLGIILILAGYCFDHFKEIDPQDAGLLSENVLMLFDVIGYKEDRYEFFGTFFIALSAFLLFLKPLGTFLKEDAGKLLAGGIASSIMIASGNSFLHYQYNPVGKVYPTAIVFSVLGFLGLVFISYTVARKFLKAKSLSAEAICGFLFVFFVVLPSTFGRSGDFQSLVLWLPPLFYISYLLWKKNRVCQPKVV